MFTIIIIIIIIIIIMQNCNFINFILHHVYCNHWGVLQYCVLWYIVWIVLQLCEHQEQQNKPCI